MPAPSPWNKARVSNGGGPCSYLMVSWDEDDDNTIERIYSFDHCYYDKGQFLPIEDSATFDNVAFLPTSCYVFWVGERVS